MVYAVIIAGGSGTRFWPRSRRDKPKQLLDIVDERTMIRATVERIARKIPFDRVMVVTVAPHSEEIRRQIPELDEGMVVPEPFGLNTAPCIALAAYKLLKIDSDPTMVVLPADHLITKEEPFLDAVMAGVHACSRGDYLLTFGIVPDRAETGYGYLKLGSAAFREGASTVYRVDTFVEKPDLHTAEHYLATGNYLWNSGMFVWQAGAIVRAFEKYLPEISNALSPIIPMLNSRDEFPALEQVYASLQAVSIDNGIMEKAENVLCIPVDVGWNDVGSWASLESIRPRDRHGNATVGRVVALDSRNCIVWSPDKLTALIGLQDLIVVETPDAVLVCSKERSQDVGRLLDLLQENGCEDLL